MFSTEAILLLRSVSSIESLYITRSSNKINDAVGQSLSSNGKIAPGTAEGTNIARIVVNEIDAARFDPLLERALAKNAATCLENILSKLDGMVCVLLTVCWEKVKTTVLSCRSREIGLRRPSLQFKPRRSKSQMPIWLIFPIKFGPDCRS